MTDPGPPGLPIPPSSKQVDDLISSPEFIRALDSDECCVVLDHLPIAVAAASPFGDQQKICYSNNAFQTLTALSAREIEGDAYAD